MDKETIEVLLKSVQSGAVSVHAALEQLKSIPFQDLGFAKVDHHRTIRTGFPEVILCQNKQPEHILAIVRDQIAHNETVFGTRASAEVLQMMEKEIEDVETFPTARCFRRKGPDWRPAEHFLGKVLIVSAGTSDAAVAQEALCTVEIMGHPCELVQDVGVAGIHRLFAHKEKLQSASVLIVVAGMEGALPSVVAGLVSSPVIGVPTSVGYGSHLNGLVPMFAMLNSCASGLTVVNIDNGFGAAMAAIKTNSIDRNTDSK